MARSTKLNGNLLPDMQTLAAETKGAFEKAIDTLDRAKAIVKLGSYGWVVSGHRTESGNPILYAGSQLGFDAPALTCEGSIRAGDLDVSGEVIRKLKSHPSELPVPYRLLTFIPIWPRSRHPDDSRHRSNSIQCLVI